MKCKGMRVKHYDSWLTFDIYRYVATVFEMMKREGDGEALAEAILKKLDTNQDGKISQEEAVAACTADPEILRLLNLSVNKHFHY